jgi:hypothetical protein
VLQTDAQRLGALIEARLLTGPTTTRWEFGKHSDGQFCVTRVDLADYGRTRTIVCEPSVTGLVKAMEALAK